MGGRLDAVGVLNDENRRGHMDIVGYIALTLAAIIVLGVITLGVITIPDIRRYLRIRNM